MASVTFPTEFGGDGNTYTDDANPTTGLANVGHRLRFVPCLAGAVDMAAWAKQQADASYANRLQAAADAAKAVSANSSAQSAADTATAAAEAATAAAETAAAIYPSVVDALGDTTDGAYFKVPESGYLQLYLNTAGAAKPVMRLASEDTLRAVQQLPDPLLTSLLF